MDKYYFRVWKIKEKELVYLANNESSSVHLQVNNHAWGMFGEDDGYVSTAHCSKDILMQYIGVVDVNGRNIYDGDIVELFGKRGRICFQSGSYGVYFDEVIDWENFENKIPEITGCDNAPHFSYHDNFIPVWELMWNYNQEENVCEILKVIGTVYTHHELLEK